MPQGLSLHVGLNGVDASKYNGWAGTLAGCVNDATAMQAIAVAQGFSPTQLITADATADAIVEAIGQAAHVLQAGDTFLISYSGHGGRVPDASGDSPDGMDDTWVAYDRMLLGHELYNLWGQFAPGVRVEVYSDSCHSGTVIRELVLTGGLFPPAKPRGAAPGRRGWPSGPNQFGDAFSTVYMAAPRSVAPASMARGVLPGPGVAARAADGVRSLGRAIPPALALELYHQQIAHFRSLQWSTTREAPTATVILISGCQDNQTSSDGTTNGLFTEKLLAVWNNGTFQGTLPQFHQAIVALMPAEQTPNYFSVGPDDATFTKSRPLTIVGTGEASGQSNSATQPATPTPVPPSVTGPQATPREGPPPAFTVGLGSNAYYIVELTSDAAAFGNPQRRTAANFYATWDDASVSPRLTDPAFTLSQSAWDAIKGNDVLYYRVGSTSSADAEHWNDYLVSVTDGDAPTLAPSVNVSEGAREGVPPSRVMYAVRSGAVRP